MLQGNNPWMLLLCEILPSESFIIAGTSLNEVDVEYYLTRRTSSTPRRGRGPSLLVEPNPDAATRADCERYDLTLVEAGFGQFLAWIEQTFPNCPSAHRLIVPPVTDLFRSTIAPATLLRFFSDFELVPTRTAAESSPTRAYMYGAEPTWSDIDEHLDVERRANQAVMNWLTKWLERPSRQERVLLVSEGPATGKSTLLKRVGARPCVTRPSRSNTYGHWRRLISRLPHSACVSERLLLSSSLIISLTTRIKFATC